MSRPDGTQFVVKREASERCHSRIKLSRVLASGEIIDSWGLTARSSGALRNREAAVSAVVRTVNGERVLEAQGGSVRSVATRTLSPLGM